MSVNLLSWPDDPVLISKPKPGLQNALDKLDSYCTQWELNVNTKKTKCMALCKGNKKVPNFSFKGEMLENVISYKYLGVT